MLPAMSAFTIVSAAPNLPGKTETKKKNMKSLNSKHNKILLKNSEQSSKNVRISTEKYNPFLYTYNREEGLAEVKKRHSKHLALFRFDMIHSFQTRREHSPFHFPKLLTELKMRTKEETLRYYYISMFRHNTGITPITRNGSRSNDSVDQKTRIWGRSKTEKEKSRTFWKVGSDSDIVKEVLPSSLYGVDKFQMILLYPIRYVSFW